jgi:hypothetical protein
MLPKYELSLTSMIPEESVFDNTITEISTYDHPRFVSHTLLRMSPKLKCY